MTIEFEYPPGATPLDAESKAGLIPSISRQSELNEFEQSNILAAALWARKSRTLKRDLVTVHGLRMLHKQMFDKTWKWAGDFRTADTNIGVAWHHIAAELNKLCDDVAFWREHNSYPTEK